MGGTEYSCLALDDPAGSGTARVDGSISTAEGTSNAEADDD